MSFDISFRTCNVGDRKMQRKNPFTGQMVEVTVDDGLTESERAAVRELLDSAGVPEPDSFGCYVVAFNDGSSAEVFADDLDGSEICEGLSVSVRAMTPQLLEFLWKLCRDGNMAAFPEMEGKVVVVASEQQRQRVQERWPEAMVIGSAKDLGELLRGGMSAWQAYRDKVIGQ